MSAGGPVDEGVPLGHSGEPESIALCDHYRHFDVKVVKVVKSWISKPFFKCRYRIVKRITDTLPLVTSTVPQ